MSTIIPKPEPESNDSEPPRLKKTPKGTRPPRCRMCRVELKVRHETASELCVACGDLNAAKRTETADLTGRYALVTGGRIHIGAATVLRLLRNGAFVIATSRYPNDAICRFAAEPDFAQWADRLRVCRLDLRRIGDVEPFAAWVTANFPRLDILINNAAQTVRPDAAQTRQLEAAEARLSRELSPGWEEEGERGRRKEGEGISSISGPPADSFPSCRAVKTAATQAQSPPAWAEENAPHGPEASLSAQDAAHSLALPSPLSSPNSWLMKDEDVSALEVLEAHVINAVAPFLLTSRLKPLLAQSPSGVSWVVNVSSQEGRFAVAKKSWRHPHTNMAKAALNMMTRTCAAEYLRHGILLNAVDPGWVTFQHPPTLETAMRARGDKPFLTLEDAAARVLTPVFDTLNAGARPSGLLWKDYREAEW